MICGIKDAKSKRLKTMISFIYHSGRDKTNLTCKKKKNQIVTFLGADAELIGKGRGKFLG